MDGNVSELTVPVVYQGTLVGVIDLEDDREAYFTTSDEQAVQAIASMLAHFLHHQIIKEERFFKLEQLDCSE